MEVLLVPEVDLVELLHVEGLVSKWGHMEVAPGGEHLAYHEKYSQLTFNNSTKTHHQVSGIFWRVEMSQTFSR